MSPRLEKILECLSSHADLWDICCDHGYLGMQALRQDLAQNVYFVDQVPSIIAKLQKQFDPHLAKIKLKNGSVHFWAQAAEVLPWKQMAGNLCIAGIGSERMIRILDHFDDDIRARASIFLCPHTKPELLETYLRHRSWAHDLKIEKVVEDGRERSIFMMR